MTLARIGIAWHAGQLWINRKPHWAVNKRSRDAQRSEAFFVASGAGWRKPITPVHDVHLTMTFCGPTRTSRFDLDGALSACKGAIDGLSACLDVDDSLFSYTLRRGDKSKAGGVIIDAEIR